MNASGKLVTHSGEVVLILYILLYPFISSNQVDILFLRNTSDITHLILSRRVTAH